MTALFALFVVAWLEPTTPALSTDVSEPDASEPDASEPDTTEPDAPVDGNGAISGVVTNSRTKAKIAEAQVVLRGSDGTERPTVTNEAGLYSFRDLPPAEYTIEVKTGKTTVAKIYALERDQKFRANFSVDPESPFSRTVRVIATPHSAVSRTPTTTICCFGSPRCKKWKRSLARAERKKTRQDARADRRRARHDP